MRRYFSHSILRYLAARFKVEFKDLDTLFNTKKGIISHYRLRKIPKKGGERPLYVPIKMLRKIQHSILHESVKLAEVSDEAHGFIRKRSIATQAHKHTRSHSLVHFDLKDAFNNTVIEYGFAGSAVGKALAKELRIRNSTLFEAVLELITVKKYRYRSERMLPQGVPTSPAMFNIMCRRMDRQLRQLAKNRGGVYTRYADGIYFSMPDLEISQELINAIRRIIERAKFQINDNKTYYIKNGNTETVPLRMCGINIINGDLYLSPTTLRHLRAALYYAGLNARHNIYLGIQGYVQMVYDCWPAQLENEYQKGRRKRMAGLNYPG